jgi:hypothetical protein
METLYLAVCLTEHCWEKTGLTQKVIRFFEVSPGFIGVYPFFSAVN